MNAAAMFLTFGYLQRAIIVNKFPTRPTNIIVIDAVAAKICRGLENLSTIELWLHIFTSFINYSLPNSFILLIFVDKNLFSNLGYVCCLES